MHRVRALLWRHVQQTLHWIGPNLISLIRPATYLLLSLGLGSSVGPVQYRGAAVPYIDFLFPGLLAMLSFEAFGSALFSAANEKQWGIFRSAALRGTRTGEYVASHVLWGLVWFGFRAAVMLGVALLFGARPNWATLPLCLLWGAVGVALWAGIGVTVGIRIDSYNVRDMLTTLMSLPIVFSSSAFFDPAKAPPVLRAIAAVNPLSFLATGGRDALLLGEFHGRTMLLVAVAATVAITVATRVLVRTPLIAQDR